MRTVRIVVNLLSLFACMAFIPYFAWNVYLHGPWVNWLDFTMLSVFAGIGLGVTVRATWEDLGDDLREK